jgi:lipopolysaccharide biosynthesis regulator YciM
LKKPQFITIGIAVVLLTGIYLFGKTVPHRATAGDHSVSAEKDSLHAEGVSIDTILSLAKKRLTADQVVRVNTLENAISRGDVKTQKIDNYHQLARFWADSVGIFEPYAWYHAEAARLENSEKSLNFAARLFLENLQADEELERRKWKALQAKDLFERSLKINPDQDSVKVGLGACYLYGNLAATPMEGIRLIREVAEKDSMNLYAQMMLGRASLVSGQYDKAISRFETVCRHQPGNIDAILLLAETYERTGVKAKAIQWYRESLRWVNQPEARAAIEQRIKELSK